MNENLPNLSLSKAGLTGLTGAATTLTITNPITYGINGKAFLKAAVAGAASPVVDGNLNTPILLLASQGVVVVWALDSGGNVKTYAGVIVAIDANGNFVKAPQFPSLPDSVAPFAYSLIKASSAAAAWTLGVSNWNAAGITIVSDDVLTLPNRPQLT